MSDILEEGVPLDATDEGLAILETDNHRRYGILDVPAAPRLQFREQTYAAAEARTYLDAINRANTAADWIALDTEVPPA